MWPLCHLELRFSSIRALLMESGHLEAGCVTTAVTVESGIPGMGSEVGKEPGVGWEA